MNIDLTIFNVIHNLAGRNALLDWLGVFCAEYLGYVLILFLFAYAFYKMVSNQKNQKQSAWEIYKNNFKMVVEALVAAGFTRFVLAEIIRKLMFRARPFVQLNLQPLINQSPLEASFPSGHATFFFALSTIVYFYNKKMGVWFYIASILIVLGRVFVGIHWPSDILAGAILGILVGWALNYLFRTHAHKVIKNYNN